MGIKQEIDRTITCSNNLTTIKNNTNTALTKNGFKTITNFSQLPKNLGDVLNNCKKYAELWVGGSTTSGAINQAEGRKFTRVLSQKPAFKPEYVFVVFSWYFSFQRPASGYDFEKNNIVISIGSKGTKDARIGYGSDVNFCFTGSYDYSKNTIEIQSVEEGAIAEGTESLSFEEVYFLA